MDEPMNLATVEEALGRVGTPLCREARNKIVRLRLALFEYVKDQPRITKSDVRRYKRALEALEL
jgi:hypothetical protein